MTPGMPCPGNRPLSNEAYQCVYLTIIYISYKYFLRPFDYSSRLLHISGIQDIVLIIFNGE